MFHTAILIFLIPHLADVLELGLFRERYLHTFSSNCSERTREFAGRSASIAPTDSGFVAWNSDPRSHAASTRRCRWNCSIWPLRSTNRRTLWRDSYTGARQRYAIRSKRVLAHQDYEISPKFPSILKIKIPTRLHSKCVCFRNLCTRFQP